MFKGTETRSSCLDGGTEIVGLVFSFGLVLFSHLGDNYWGPFVQFGGDRDQGQLSILGR